jgi:hypothetical protein
MDGSVRSGGSVVVGAAEQVESHGSGDRSARSEGRELSGAAASEGRPEVVSIVMGDVASAGQAATAAVGRLGRTGSQHMTRSVAVLTKDRNQAGGGRAIRRAEACRRGEGACEIPASSDTASVSDQTAAQRRDVTDAIRMNLHTQE